MALAVTMIGEKTEIDGRAERIERRGRRGTDHEEDDLRVQQTVAAVVMVRRLVHYLFPHFLTKMARKKISSRISEFVFVSLGMILISLEFQLATLGKTRKLLIWSQV